MPSLVSSPTLWSIEPQHRLVVRISTQPASDDCLDPLGVPVGCYPTNPMLESLRGGSYTLLHGGTQASLISLPLVKHGAFPSATSAVSPQLQSQPRPRMPVRCQSTGNADLDSALTHDSR